MLCMEWELYLVYIETNKNNTALYVTAGHMLRHQKSVAHATCLSGKLEVR